jgi:hypothetical protein
MTTEERGRVSLSENGKLESISTMETGWDGLTVNAVQKPQWACFAAMSSMSSCTRRR